MATGYIVLFPVDFDAEEHESQIKDFFSTSSEDFEEYRFEVMEKIDKFAKGNETIYYSDESFESIGIYDLLVSLASQLECIIMEIPVYDGEGFITNLRECEEKIEELL